jgi:hypothetical protein
MMQTLRISDALRCILLNAPRGPNLACPREGLSGTAYPRNTQLWKETFSQSRNRISVVWWDGLTLGGLASARVRSGSRVWEVDRFYLTGLAEQGPSDPLGQPDAWTPAWVNLLERLVQAAGERQAERVFLRLPRDHPSIPVARRAGFFPYFNETLLEGAGAPAFPGSQTPDPTGPDARLPEDSFALFQLYSAASPLPVREALGLTFDQWRDAQDPHGRRRREWTVSHNGRITGWLGLHSHHQEAEGEVLVHPDHPETLPALLALALSQPGRHRWLAPDYQPQVVAELERRGFQSAAEYTMLVTTVAARVLQPGIAPPAGLRMEA